MYSGFPGLSLNRNLERGVTAIGGFRSDPYLDKGYSGVQLSPTQGGIPTNKMVIGQYTYNSPIRGQGSQNYFVVADAPQQQAAPAAAPAAPVPAAIDQKIVELNEASQKYRQESEAALKAAQAQIEQMKIQQQAPAIEAANLARGAQSANLQIQPSSTTSQTAGTQAFKRRRQQTEMPSIQSLGTLNVPTSSVLNV